MKQHLETLVRLAIKSLQQQDKLASDLKIKIQLERAREKQFGDYASNIAMMLAKPANYKPRELAELIAQHIPKSNVVREVAIAGPGFINFVLTEHAYVHVIPEIFSKGVHFGEADLGAGKRINIEFVSSNPTGPLHVGHGRGAAYGATLANLLIATGFQVEREYYVNDAGRQMDILALSVWLRYLIVCGEQVCFPSNGYQGEYVMTIAEQFKARHGDALKRSASEVFVDIPADENLDQKQQGDKEAHIDALIKRAKALLGEQQYRAVLDFALNSILVGIKDDLGVFGVHFERWFSERDLQTEGAITHVINGLEKTGHVYERNGAKWFASIPFGDDKDRVLAREDGRTTYFASDTAYLLNKFERGFDEIICILGADHHGYVPRLKAVAKALGKNPNHMHIVLVQFATLYRGDQRVQMSTRSGSFVTLRELLEEVGADAARFFYMQRKSEQHMDFDLELAKSKSNENPVYYIQYAHARICSVFRQLAEKGWAYDQNAGVAALFNLTHEHEKDLLKNLSRYPEVIYHASKSYEPHPIAVFLRELAHNFHTYYNSQKFLVNEADMRNARLCLIAAVKQVLNNGLSILGVSAPEVM